MSTVKIHLTWLTRDATCRKSGYDYLNVFNFNLFFSKYGK